MGSASGVRNRLRGHLGRATGSGFHILTILKERERLEVRSCGATGGDSSSGGTLPAS